MEWVWYRQESCSHNCKIVGLLDLREIVPIWLNLRSLFGQFCLSSAGQHSIEGMFRFWLCGKFRCTGLYSVG